jgi:restriction system protein
MSVLDAVHAVLEAEGKPLHYRDITRLALQRGLWRSDGATPDATVNSRLAVDIQNLGASSRFQRTGKGLFALRAWGLVEYQVKRTPVASKPAATNGASNESAVVVEQPTPSRGMGRKFREAGEKSMSFTDATEFVLRNYGGGRPMHYRAITDKALELGLLRTKGQTPEATLYSQVLSEVDRRKKRGETPRFVRHPRGVIALQEDEPRGLALDIQRHNNEVRTKLLAILKAMPPGEFEQLVGSLLGKLGFDQVDITRVSGDGGIDVRGVLVVGDVIRTKMAVQVKRWKHNVQAPIVQQVRGSLGAHEQGLIITTSDFSAGARSEAERADTTPVGLMDGKQLVALLVEHQIGVARTDYHLLELVALDEPGER